MSACLVTEIFNLNVILAPTCHISPICYILIFFELVMVFESSAFIQIQENGRTAIYLFGDDSLFKVHENL